MVSKGAETRSTAKGSRKILLRLSLCFILAKKKDFKGSLIFVLGTVRVDKKVFVECAQIWGQQTQCGLKAKPPTLAPDEENTAWGLL